ncbi:MAG TPA: hypothetical protein DHW63_06935 [Hyphomonadaceae bacterium]|nr:hypothetical protein [Hyphomonadaceae bacterium]
MLLLLALAACAGTAAPQAGARRAIDVAAEQYVRLALEIDTHEEGYVDAYFGPREWRDQARANPRSIYELQRFSWRIEDEVNSVLQDRDDDTRRRAFAMREALRSARFRLDMIGHDFPWAGLGTEAEFLFALKDLPYYEFPHYEPILASIDAMLPGEGPLNERVEAFRARYVISPDRLQAVMERAIGECRARTRAHLLLPENESFRMEFVTGKSWSAYNWYQGNNQSLIQVNTDIPLTIDRALALACHEGYPGHHVQGIYNERNYRERGWPEYSVAPLYHPSAPLNEGGGNFGVEMAFPGDERLAFERDTLYPLAGLDPAGARAYHDLQQALNELQSARLMIAAGYLRDGLFAAQFRNPNARELAIEQTMNYLLVSRARAEQLIAFTDHYRSYVVNYVAGEVLIRDYVNRVAGDEEGARWAAFERIMSEPTLPRDLQP